VANSPLQTPESPYVSLRQSMQAIHDELTKGEPRYALTNRMGGPFQWEQVAGRTETPPLNMERIHAAVAQRLAKGR
jgi:hypothetical protein